MFSGKDNKLLIAAELVEEKSVEDGILGSWAVLLLWVIQILFCFWLLSGVKMAARPFWPAIMWCKKNTKNPKIESHFQNCRFQSSCPIFHQVIDKRKVLQFFFSVKYENYA
jgi:hypothetical protein